MSYESNLGCIISARMSSKNPSEKDVAFTLQKLRDRNLHKSYEDCIIGFAKWAEHKWASGMELPKDLTKYLTEIAFNSRTGDMLGDWVKAQEYVASQIYV